jgi:DNA polymerase-3 subunit delta
MDTLANEVAKLSSYLKANGRSALTPEAVREVASSTPEADTFALSNAILDRNKKAAFDALSDMKRQRSEPTVIVGMMAKTYSELLAVTMLKEDGLDQAKIEAALGIHPFKVKSYLKAARLFKAGAPRAILDELSRVDVGMKFGGVLGYTAIEMFIAKCL